LGNQYYFWIKLNIMTSQTNTSMRAGFILIFLTALNVLNFIDRFMLQGFALDLTTELHLSHVQFTLLTGFVFTTFYTVAGLAMGALADRLHRPRLMAAGLFAWSALTAATGMVGNFAQIGLVRMFTGVGEATLTPAALGLLGDLMSPKRRAFAAGFYYLGSPLGIGAAFLIAGTLGHEIGWRHCFMVLGAAGLILTLPLLLMHENRAATELPENKRGNTAAEIIGDIRRTLSGSPTLCLVILGGVLVIFAQGTMVLDQLWLVQERGFDAPFAQKISGLMFMAGGMLGALIGGGGADWMQARVAGGRLRFLVFTYAIGVPVSLLYRFVTPGGPAFFACMFIGSMMITIGYGPIFACVQDLVAERLRSTMTAFLILCMTLLGTSPGNLLAGWLTDSFATQGVAHPITLATTIGLLPWLLAIPCFWAAAKRMKPSAP
jgi:MFS family permease